MSYVIRTQVQVSQVSCDSLSEYSQLVEYGLFFEAAGVGLDMIKLSSSSQS